MFEISLDEIFQMNQRKLDTQIQFKKTLAKGAFGTVALAYDKTKHQEVAIKIIQKNNERQTIIHQFSDEINVLKKTNHPNIVHFFDYIETKDKVYIIMEYIKGGTLEELMTLRSNILSDNEVKQIIKYLLKAVDHLHKFGICHRDIKLANIMFNSFDDFSTLKLIDFGLSTDLSTNSLKFCGTILFMSPERLMKKNYSSAIDIWSIGIILYMLLHNRNHPFYSNQDNMISYLQVVLNTSIEKKISPLISFFASNLIRKLVEVKPSIRYSAPFALHHPWISQDYTRLDSHLLKEEIVKFQSKQVNIFLSILFLSQYNQATQKKARIEKESEKESNQIETDYYCNNTMICRTNSKIRKKQFNALFWRKEANKEAIIISKTKITTHLALFSQFTPCITQGVSTELDSQSIFSTKDKFQLKRETQSNKSLIKLKVVKSKEIKDERRLSLMNSTPSKFLSLMFSKKQNKQKVVAKTKKKTIAPINIDNKSSSQFYNKTFSTFSKDLKSEPKKSKNKFPLVLPLIKTIQK